MNNIDKVSKDVKIIIDSAKDLAEKNILAAAMSHELDITVEQVAKIIKIMKATLEDSYQRSLPNFQNTIKKYVPTK